MKVPCKDCKDRFVTESQTCHATCELYKEWKKEYNDETMRLAKKKSLDNASYSTEESIAIRNQKRKKYKNV